MSRPPRHLLGALLAASLACSSEAGRPGDPFTAIDAASHEAFPVDSASAHGGVDCNGCHGGFDSFTQFTCTSCHEHSEDVLDPVHSGVGAYRHEDGACLGCHLDGSVEGGGAEHSFPIVLPAVHADVGCSECHVDGQPRSVFDCVTCHGPSTRLESQHAVVSGFVAESASCYLCHSDGSAMGLSREDHRAFPIVNEEHGDIACGACHIDGSDVTRVGCAECHLQEDPALGSAHGSIGDYASSSPECQECHPLGTVPVTVSAHGAQGVDVRSPHDECRGCHDELDADVVFPASDFAQFSCLGSCHQHTEARMDDKHSDERDYRFVFTVCLECHPDARNR